MKKCKTCGKDARNTTMYAHNAGGYICSECIGDFFVCPDCGMIFDRDDYENGDAGNGFCAKCSSNH